VLRPDVQLSAVRLEDRALFQVESCPEERHALAE
jgi:hypothetical protein